MFAPLCQVSDVTVLTKTQPIPKCIKLCQIKAKTLATNCVWQVSIKVLSLFGTIKIITYTIVEAFSIEQKV